MSDHVLDIVEVSQAPGGSDIWAFWLDSPREGAVTGAAALEIEGWVLGSPSPVIAIELTSGETLCRRLPLSVSRPDVVAHFAEFPVPEKCGFRTLVHPPGIAELDLQALAVLRDQRRVPLVRIRARRRWRELERSGGTPLVSVVIPCFRQAHFLGETIESVLAQTYPHFEIVVVDDGSPDNTAAVAARYPGVRCLRLENSGPALARNAGLRASNGDFLVFLDGDDRLLPEALEAGLQAFAAEPEAAFVSGQMHVIGYDGAVSYLSGLPPAPGPDRYAALLRKNTVAGIHSVLFRRAALDAVGGFRGETAPAADYDIYLRLARLFPVGVHTRLIAEYRRYGSNMSYDPGLMLTSALTSLRDHRRHARRRKDHWQAYRAGIRFWRSHYGSELVSRFDEALRDRRWARARHLAWDMARLHPGGIPKLAGVVARVVRFRLAAALGRRTEPAPEAVGAPRGES